MRLFATGLVLATVCIHATNAELEIRKRVIQYPPHVPVQHGSFIVEFDNHMVHTHAETLNSMPSVSVHKRFTDGFHGAVVATSKHITPEMLAYTPGVKRIWPNRRHTLSSRVGKRDITTPYAHQMTGVSQAMQEFGLNGSGVKIGIIDTGVDYNHPELGGCWKTDGCPWQFGQDFIGDKYDMDSDNPTIEPNDTPMDCDGHGTHVAGIIAGRGPQIQGIAPDATLGMYRVASCPINGTTETSDSLILQGMVAALRDKLDIIHLSMSTSTGGWAEDPISVMASNIVAQGVAFVSGSGDAGYDGLQSAISPAVGRGVISVGAVDNWNVTNNVTKIYTPDGIRIIRLSDSQSNGLAFLFEKATPLAVSMDGNSNFYGCNATNTDFTGSIVVVQSGECEFGSKAYTMQSQGAAGMIIVNNGPGVYLPTIPANVTIPCALVSEDDGEFIVKGIAAGASTLITDSANLANFNNPDGGQMASFSSYGPSPALDLIPLISAPGGDIWSTYPTNKGSYTSMSGTSMASSYVAGCAALLRQKFPNYSVNQIRQILVNAAVPLDNANTGLKISPFRSGAGLVNVYNALNSRVLINPPYLSINESDWSQPNDSGANDAQGVRLSSYIFNFTNTDTSKGVNVILANNAADSLSLYDTDGNYAQSILDSGTVPTWPKDATPVPINTIAQAILPNDTQNIAAGQSVQFNVTIILPYGLDESARWFFGGFLNFTLTFDGETDTVQHVVPYGGFNGNYSNINMLSPSSLGYPHFMDSDQNPIQDISTYTIDPANPPLLAYSIDVPSKFVYTAYIDSNNKSLGILDAGHSIYTPRTLQNSNPYLTTTISNATTTIANLSNTSIIQGGKYRLRLAVLRPSGNIEDDSDFQIWDSAEFTLS